MLVTQLNVVGSSGVSEIQSLFDNGAMDSEIVNAKNVNLQKLEDKIVEFVSPIESALDMPGSSFSDIFDKLTGASPNTEMPLICLDISGALSAYAANKNAIKTRFDNLIG